MADQRKPITSIVLLLAAARVPDLGRIERAVADAFRSAPAPPKVIALPNGRSFGVMLGPLRLGISMASQPYFKDIARVADSITNFPARMAVQKHTAWLGVDLIGQSPIADGNDRIYGVIGMLVAELLGDDVLGMLRLPGGPVVAYDPSMIALLRSRRATDVFANGAPDRVVRPEGREEALAAASDEARRRFPEFVAALAAATKGQGFAVKKRFDVGGTVEHMWVSVTRIDAEIHGTLANDPQVIRSMKLGDAVTVALDDVEDWIYTNGKENVGGFQIAVLKAADRRPDRWE